MGLEKHCVFCGKKPRDKSREHVVPKWLIELTGDPSRNANFGFSKNITQKTLEPRTFAFDQFTFPACSACNQKFSRLEANVKTTMMSVLNAEMVSASALSELLDWFDKVRIGLWLGMRVLDKDVADVDPNFHIETRLGQHDRLLIVEKSDYSGKRLNFVGVDTISFALTPSAFMLIVNNYHFTNVSSLFLCARRLGFPYAQSMRLHPGRDETEVQLANGRERVTRPIMRRGIAEKGSVIYQPMFKGGLVEEIRELYDTEYVREHSLRFSDGVGNLFVESSAGVKEIYRHNEICLNPSKDQASRVLDIHSGINILEWQLWLHEELPNMDLLSQEQRRYIKARFGGADRINKALLQHYRKMLKSRH
jgi:hypothetical protein